MRKLRLPSRRVVAPPVVCAAGAVGCPVHGAYNDIDCTTRRAEQVLIHRDNPIGFAEEIAGAFLHPLRSKRRIDIHGKAARPAGATKLRRSLKLGHGGAAGRRAAAGVLFRGHKPLWVFLALIPPADLAA